MPTSSFMPGRAFAQHLDAADELRGFRERFTIPDQDLIYLDGNSLGRPPHASVDRLQTAAMKEWAGHLIRGWNAGWFRAPSRAGEKIASLVGAAPGQVIIADSTSINLFKLTLAALTLRPGRTVIVSDVLNFPSDLYVLQGCARLLGDLHQLALAPTRDEIGVGDADLHPLINHQTALVCLSHVAYKSGFLYDAAAVTHRAHQAGALMLWDLSHSVGVVPIELDRWGVDLAVGCTYKYLNGGPGSPAFLYIRRDLQERLLSPIWGWFGQKRPFAFDLDYAPAPGIERFLAGTPPILSLLALEASLDLTLEAGIDPIRRKSVSLTSYLIDLAGAVLSPLGFTLASPKEAARRGSHVNLRHPEGYRISRALGEEMGVLGDFREPDNLRLGLAPLYTTYGEVWEAVDRIRRCVQGGRYLHYSAERLPVT
jgi:kynureninase